VHRAQQHRQRLVHEDEDDAELGEVRGIHHVPAADERQTQTPRDRTIDAIAHSAAEISNF
jgi:hypothetical protein